MSEAAGVVDRNSVAVYLAKLGTSPSADKQA